MAAAGIGPGRKPVAANSGNAAQYRKALGLGARLLTGAVGGGSTRIWNEYIQAAVGSYGTDYLERALVAKETLGTQVPAQAVYLGASRARSGTTTTALVGASSYEIRFPAGDLPPHGADGFWSITLYNAAGYLVANPINRYSIGNETPGLVQGADGSLTIIVSASRPARDGRELAAGAQGCLQPRAPRVQPDAIGTRRFLVPARNPGDQLRGDGRRLKRWVRAVDLAVALQ